MSYHQFLYTLLCFILLHRFWLISWNIYIEDRIVSKVVLAFTIEYDPIKLGSGTTCTKYGFMEYDLHLY